VFFVELGIFLSVYYLKHRSYLVITLIGIATGCALLIKWLPGLIIVGILFLLLIQQESWKQVIGKCAIVIMIAAILVAPWQIYIYSTFPKEAAWESYLNYLHITKPLDGHDGSVFFHILRMPGIFGELIYIPIIMFIYAFFKNKLNKTALVLAFWFVVPYVFFSFVATKMPGYIMLSAPAIFIILSWAFWTVRDNLKTSSYRILKIIFLVLLVLLPIRTAIERIRPFQQSNRNEQWAVSLRGLNKQIPQSNAVVFNLEHNIEAMFYSNFIAYPFIPSKEQIQIAVEKGYAVYIINGPSISPELRDNKQITVLRN
jgi:4-amino-4-deoxy-L-arabinose transferase-like glycosyltransferase